MADFERSELLVLSGGVTPAAADGVERVIAWFQATEPRTAVVHHDLSHVAGGVVVRRVRIGGSDRTTLLRLVHGCVDCTLRGDVLPLLRELGKDPAVDRILLHIDPALEPERVCTAILHVLVNGSPVTDAVDLRGVLTVLDVASWLNDAVGSERPTDRGLAALPGDDRTMAQLVVGQAEFADLLVCAGEAEDWLRVHTDAVLARLAPLAHRLSLTELDSRLLLTDPPLGARRGRPESAHAPLLRGQPPLEEAGGITLLMFTARRPFHAERLHRAIAVLMRGVVRTRGRVWLANRPDVVLWLRSAGGGLRVGYAGDWLAAGDAQSWQDADPQRHAQAALRWHPVWGDRAQDLSILVYGADAGEISSTLRSALLTDAELAGGEAAWRDYPDPFGLHHAEPCNDIAPRFARWNFGDRPDQEDGL